MEQKILFSLEFDIQQTSSYRFLERYSKIAKADASKKMQELQMALNVAECVIGEECSGDAVFEALVQQLLPQQLLLLLLQQLLQLLLQQLLQLLQHPFCSASPSISV